MRARLPSPLLALALAFGAAACTGTTEYPGGPSKANPLDEDENAFARAINTARLSAKLPSFKICASLNSSASTHADDMRDNGVTGDKGSDGSDVRTRACAAGYMPSCNGATIPMAELVATGNEDGTLTEQQFAGDPMSSMIMLNPELIVMGVGISLGAADGEPRWAIDFGGVLQSDCQ
jgi:uncharacterized protein YkwD